MEIHNYSLISDRLDNPVQSTPVACNSSSSSLFAATPTFDQQEQDFLQHQYNQQPKKYFRMNSLEFLSIISEMPSNSFGESITNLFNNMTKSSCSNLATFPAVTNMNNNTCVAPNNVSNNNNNNNNDPLEVPQAIPCAFNPATMPTYTFITNTGNAGNYNNNNFIPMSRLPLNTASIIASSLNKHLNSNNNINNAQALPGATTALVNSFLITIPPPPPPADDNAEFNIDTFLCSSSNNNNNNNNNSSIEQPSIKTEPFANATVTNSKKMEKFPVEQVSDLKHVIYNLLVDNYNNPQLNTFVQPCTMKVNGSLRHGFCFNERANPDKKLAELYAQHIRKGKLEQEDYNNVFIQDLYKFYLRACVELLAKYFEKTTRDKYTFLYDDDTPLFVAGGSLEEAEERIKHMKTRARKRKASTN